MKKTNRLIVGSALSLAAIAVAIDHTKHRLPDPVPAEDLIIILDDDEESPCGMSTDSPCSMDSDMDDDSDSSPCGMGD